MSIPSILLNRATHFGESPPLMHVCGLVEVGQSNDSIDCSLSWYYSPLVLVKPLGHVAANWGMHQHRENDSGIIIVGARWIWLSGVSRSNSPFWRPQ